LKAEKIILSDDSAWRLLTRTVSRKAGEKLVTFSSDNELCRSFLNVKAIMNNDY
jgi:hypothetical protein